MLFVLRRNNYRGFRFRKGTVRAEEAAFPSGEILATWVGNGTHSDQVPQVLKLSTVLSLDAVQRLLSPCDIGE